MDILIITDNQTTLLPIATRLSKENYFVNFCESYEIALNSKEIFNHHIIIIDINKSDPQKAMQMTQEMQKMKNLTSIITLIISPHKCLTTKVRFLNSGADAYITKPLHNEELVALINTLSRIYMISPQQHLNRHKYFTLNNNKNTITIKGREISLTGKEKEVLLALMQHQGLVATKKYLLKKVWDINTAYHSNILEATVKRLRQKLQSSRSNITISSIRGIGYMLEVKS